MRRSIPVSLSLFIASVAPAFAEHVVWDSIIVDRSQISIEFGAWQSGNTRIATVVAGQPKRVITCFLAGDPSHRDKARSAAARSLLKFLNDATVVQYSTEMVAARATESYVVPNGKWTCRPG